LPAGVSEPAYLFSQLKAIEGANGEVTLQLAYLFLWIYFPNCYVILMSKREWGEVVKIAVVDGQGGGIGRIIVEKLRQELGNSCHIIGLGTNAIAVSLMLKAGANEGASGENAVIHCASRVDVIAGSVAIVAAHSFLGELTPAMAEAIASGDAIKVLIPLNRYNLEISGVVDEPLPLQVNHLVARVRQIYDSRKLR